LNGEIVKPLINNKTQKMSMRQMPHMKALCDRAILLRWLEKKTLAEQVAETVRNVLHCGDVVQRNLAA